MVAYLEKSTGSAGFHQIIDFITRCHIHYALTKKPEVCVSFIRQFWRSAEIVTDDDGSVKIHASIDGHSLSISEGSLRRHLKLDDQMDYLLFHLQDSAQLRLWICILNSDNPKKTAWEQFSSNIAVAIHIFTPSPTHLHLQSTPESTHAPPSPQPPTPQPSPPQPSPTHLGSDYHPPTPHDSPLHAVHSHGSDEGSLKLQELMTLVTILLTGGGSSLRRHLKMKKEDMKKQLATQEEDTTLLVKKFLPVESTAGVHISTAGETATYSRRSAEKRKDKGKGIMTDEEPRKKSKKELEQERLSFAEAIRIEEQMHEEQRAQIARDAEIARQWDEEERKRVMDEAKATKKIDWNDPSVLRYHSLKLKPKSIAQARRNMVKYLKNQGNFKMTDFKGMSYNEVRPVFEKIWDFNQKFVPLDAENASKKQMSPEKEKSPEKIMKEKAVTQEKKEEVPKEPTAKRKKSIP
ncbi:hypothetical protein Tco_0587597 [Tanacetum coccineum]